MGVILPCMQGRQRFSPQDWIDLKRGIEKDTIDKVEITRLCTKIFEAVDLDSSGDLDEYELTKMAAGLLNFREKNSGSCEVKCFYGHDLFGGQETKIRITIEEILLRMGTTESDESITLHEFLTTSIKK